MHTDPKNLETFLIKASQVTKDEQRSILGGFLLKLCIKGLDQVIGPLPDYVGTLHNWIRDSPAFNGLNVAFPAGYKNLLLYFAGDSELRKMYETAQLRNQEYFSHWNYLMLTQSATPEQISQVRFLAHFISVVWSSDKHSLLYFFRELFEEPGKVSSTQTFLP